MIVSSTSTNAYPPDVAGAQAPGELNSRVRAAKPSRNRDATASSCRTCPKVNARRNDPSVEGAYAEVKTLLIPPWRSTAMSSMLSAPASIPPTIEATFSPGLAPLSVATVRRSSVTVRRPAASASAITGTRPADDTKFGSSKTAEVRVGV